MICGSCASGDHHLSRHDLHPCSCDHPRCRDGYPSEGTSDEEQDRDRRADFGYFDSIDLTDYAGYQIHAESHPAAQMAWAVR